MTRSSLRQPTSSCRAQHRPPAQPHPHRIDGQLAAGRTTAAPAKDHLRDNPLAWSGPAGTRVRPGPGTRPPQELTGCRDGRGLSTGPGDLTVTLATAPERQDRHLPRGRALAAYGLRPRTQAVHIVRALRGLLHRRHGWSASGTRSFARRQRSHANSFPAVPTCTRRAVSLRPRCQLHHAIRRGSSAWLTPDPRGAWGGGASRPRTSSRGEHPHPSPLLRAACRVPCTPHSWAPAGAGASGRAVR